MSNTTRTVEPRCADCGGRARAGQSFCDDCGSFLNWDSGKESTISDESSAEAGAATPEATKETDTHSEPLPGKHAEAETVTGAKADTGSEDDTTEVLSEPVGPDSPTPPPAAVPPDVARARALLVPVADPSRAAQHPPEVAPVLPGTPTAARPTVRAPGDDEHVPHGDTCPWCGTSNQPERHYCRRCAMRLAETPGGPQRRPWWRRLLDFRGREAPWAGERPRLRRDLGRIVRWTLGTAVVVTLVITVANETTPATHAVEDHFATRAQIHEITFSASNSGAGQGPGSAGDGYNNTWWGSGYGGPNTGQWLQANFTTPEHLLNVIITPCTGSESDAISLQECPSELEAYITNSSGKVTTQMINLDDGQPQTFGMDARDVMSVRFSVLSVYGESPSKEVAIAEIEFFGPSSS